MFIPFVRLIQLQHTQMQFITRGTTISPHTPRPTDEFNVVLTESLPVYHESVVTIHITVFPQGGVVSWIQRKLQS